MSWQSLVSVDDVVRDAGNSLTLSSESDDDRAAIQQAIRDMGSVIETHLHRKLIVRKTVQTLNYDFGYYDWEFGDVYVYLRQYPVVEILNIINYAGQDVTDQYSLHPDTLRKDYMLQSADQNIQTIRVTAYTGYRATGATLAQIQMYTDDHADMTELPAELPADIRNVCTRLVLNQLTLASNQQFGISQVSRSIGSQDIDVEAPSMNFVAMELSKLEEYRRLY